VPASARRPSRASSPVAARADISAMGARSMSQGREWFVVPVEPRGMARGWGAESVDMGGVRIAMLLVDRGVKRDTVRCRLGFRGVEGGYGLVTIANGKVSIGIF
jgi:hypothetical protein